MESITLGEQKREKVPRISGEEALILLGLAKTRITTKTNEVNIYSNSLNLNHLMPLFVCYQPTHAHNNFKFGFRLLYQKLITVHQLILWMNPRSKWDV